MESRRRTRVFLDSSVFFAAAISPSGPARELIHQGQMNRCLLVASELMLEETRRNLARKNPDELAVVEQFLALVPLKVVPHPPREDVVEVADRGA